MPAAFSRRLLVSALLALALLGTGGCSSLKFWDRNKGDKVIEGSPEQLYRDAIKDIKSNNYPGAIQRYEMLEARYPFSEQAKQGQLDLIYAYYKNRSADSAIDQSDQFIRENPTHPRVDYAYYVRGLVYFDSGANWLERKFKANIAKRPPHEARKSFQAFQVLVQQYPKSPYAADARQRMVYLRNRLADYEIEVARYYLKRGAYVGAANRAKGVIEGYDGAPAVDDALKILAASYRKLGVDDLAQATDKVRATNAYTVPDQMDPAAVAAGTAGSGHRSATAVAADGSWAAHRRRPGNGKPPWASSLPTRATSTSRAAPRPRSTAALVSWRGPAITSPIACGSGRPLPSTRRITALTSQATHRASPMRSRAASTRCR